MRESRKEPVPLIEPDRISMAMTDLETIGGSIRGWADRPDRDREQVPQSLYFCPIHPALLAGRSLDALLGAEKRIG